MARTRLKVVYKKKKPYLICDTNVWYEMSAGKFEKTNEYDLIPTAFSLVELATSQAMIEEPKFYQDTVKMIYDNCGPIIPENPFDYILQYQFGDYKPKKDGIVNQILPAFGELMAKEINADSKIDEELKKKVIEECRKSRGIAQDLADFGNDDLMELRSNINKGVGKKDHLKVDASQINREMLMSILDHYTNDKDYKINWDKFDWGRIDLFMTVTEIYFKKLETTRDMKIKANDIVDWFNLLYVSPDDKYLTFDDRWRNYILNDERIKQYLFFE